MHVLVIPSWYPQKGNEINGSFFSEQARSLSRFGHKVTVLPYYNLDISNPSDGLESSDGFSELPICYRKLPFHLTFFSIIEKMRKALKGTTKPDIIHVQSFNAIKYARALSRIYHIPFVVEEHATWFERGLLTSNELVTVSKDYNSASAVIAVSDGLKQKIQPLTKNNVIIVPNSVNELFFQVHRNCELNFPFQWVSVGMLQGKKGFDVLLKAFAETAEKIPAMQLTICGDGEERNNLEQLVKELNIQDKVVFAGMVSREDCVKYMISSDAFVLPSRFETFGIVYAEAMAAGLPIVMTKTNAWQMLVTDKTGMAVEIDDVVALSNAMEKVVKNYKNYDFQFISQWCHEHYSEKTVCEKLTEVYQQVLLNYK